MFTYASDPEPNQASGQLSQPLQLLEEDYVGLILRTASGALGGQEMKAESRSFIVRAKPWRAGAIPTTSMRSAPHGWQTAGS